MLCVGTFAIGLGAVLGVSEGFSVHCVMCKQHFPVSIQLTLASWAAVCSRHRLLLPISIVRPLLMSTQQYKCSTQAQRHPSGLLLLTSFNHHPSAFTGFNLIAHHRS